MNRYKLTRKARTDLASVLLYTTGTWGEEQAKHYLSLFSNSFDLIAQNPGLGRACHALMPGLRRFEVGSHVVFYRVGRGTIIIGRILHRKRLPSRLYFIDT